MIMVCCSSIKQLPRSRVCTDRTTVLAIMVAKTLSNIEYSFLTHDSNTNLLFMIRSSLPGGASSEGDYGITVGTIIRDYGDSDGVIGSRIPNW